MYQLFIQPKKFFQSFEEISENQLFNISLTLFTFAGFFQNSPKLEQPASFTLIVDVLMGMLFSVALGLLSSLLVFGLGKLLKQKGKLIEVIAILAYSEVIWIMLYIIYGAVRFFHLQEKIEFSQWEKGLTTGFILWNAYFIAQGLHYLYGSDKRMAMILTLPVIAIKLAFFLFILVVFNQ